MLPRPYLWHVALLMALFLVAGCAASNRDRAPSGLAEASQEITREPGGTATLMPTKVASATSLPTSTPTIKPSATRRASPTSIPSPTVTATPTPQAEMVYTVLAGDTISDIAQRYGVVIEELLLYNNIADPRQMQVGATLRIPVAAEQLQAVRATATALGQIAATAAARPARVMLPLPHTYQQRNNCAPATTSMILRGYGIQTSQGQMASLQKPNAADVNVTAEEVAASIRASGLEAFVAYGGTIEGLQRLLAAGFPVMTEEWMPYDGGMGHFRAIRGYDREAQQIFYNDSFYGPDRWRSYDVFLRDWKPYNNKYIVAYRPEQAEQLRQIIGADWDQAANLERLRAESTAQTAASPADGYAWWGLGEALQGLGKPEEAVAAFEQALATETLPWRYLWYRYGYFEALNQLGRYEEVLSLTTPVLRQMGASEDLRYHRAVALRALGRTEEASAELEQALRDNPRFAPAALLLPQLD